MYNLKNIAFTGLLTVGLLAACTEPVGPQSSGIAAPSMWTQLPRVNDAKDPTSLMTPSGQSIPDVPVASSNEAEIDHRWWNSFQDHTLDTLIAEALANNKSLQIAKARVEEARASRSGTASSLYPQISAVGSAQRGNQGYATLNQPVTVAEADVEATWELDLFGRNQARTAQATAILQSQEANEQAVRVSLLAEVARNYFDMRNYERQIDLTHQNLDTENRTLQLIKAQVEGAYASDFDVQRAGAQVSTTEALIPALQTSYDAALNRLNVLLGYPPGTKDTLLKAPQPLQPLSPRILIAAPAKVIATRPDVKVAERQFAASISNQAVARADLFPNISLTALFGAQTATPFTSTPWGLGVNLIQPILNFGRIQAEIDVSDAQQKQAMLNYQQTVLEALENMENALSSYLHETIRNASLHTGVMQNQKAADLAQQQYSNGYTALLDVLVAQRNLLDAQGALAASDAALRKDLVNIYAAAGGGWND
jgi:NodT family efflux transporter outer membrane factor (OMF) lipoprotein